MKIHSFIGLALAVACGGSNKSAPGNVTISGQLQSGTVTHAASGPLAGYKLYCVTFAQPPVAGSATADASGNVSLTLAAQGVAFGCFVQDTSGASVATLSFSSGSASGTTLTTSSDASLGTITVDLTSGLASANVPAGSAAVASTPAGATCPTGNWVFGTGPADPACTSLATASTAKVWIAPAPGGGYQVSIIHGPESHGGTSCSYGSYQNIPAVFANGALTIGPFLSSSAGSQCANHLTIVMTPSADCTTATAAGSFTGCGSCGTAPNYCAGNNGGTTCNANCSANWTGSRQ